MKIIRLKNFKNSPDTQKTLSECVQTVDGFESAHINLGTGEITYSKECRGDENALRDALAKKGIEVEKK